MDWEQVLLKLGVVVFVVALLIVGRMRGFRGGDWHTLTTIPDLKFTWEGPESIMSRAFVQRGHLLGVYNNRLADVEEHIQSAPWKTRYTTYTISHNGDSNAFLRISPANILFGKQINFMEGNLMTTGDAEFDMRFLVRCNSPELFDRVLATQPDLRALLLRWKILDLKIEAGNVICELPGRMKDSTRVTRSLDMLCAVAATLD